MIKSAPKGSLRETAALIDLFLGGTGILLVLAGVLGHIAILWLAGIIIIFYSLAHWPWRAAVKSQAIIDQLASSSERPAARPESANGSHEIEPSDTEGLVNQMLAQQRYALLLRPRIASDLEAAQFQKALSALQEQMALVPDGEVTLGPVDGDINDVVTTGRGPTHEKIHVVRVKRFFLDRYPVTNRQYFEFVAAGGYQNASLWDELVLPAVLDFVDQTGEPGPRFWKEGCFLEGMDDHPVVGVCWHEAAAYARWVGKRLPSDAEWVKSGTWPVPTTDGGRLQRMYPWGDDMDRSRANLWGSGPGHVVGVHEFDQGISLGGVYQLIGNVWEWTAGDFLGGDHELGRLTFKTPMKSIRGGAFDTYFDNQATCQFQSGDCMLSRKRNIGFRLAIGMCDLMLDRPIKQHMADETAETEASNQETDKDGVTHLGMNGEITERQEHLPDNEVYS